MFKNKLYFVLISIVFLDGCANDTKIEPIQIVTSQNAGSSKVDQNLIDYHINKKKIRYKVKKSNSEEPSFLRQRDKNFDDVNVSNVENSKDSFYKNLIPESK